MKKEKNNFSEAYVKANRSFPKRNTVILIILVILQFLLLYAVLTYRPKPQDVIKEYRVTVYPCEDATLVGGMFARRKEQSFLLIKAPSAHF